MAGNKANAVGEVAREYAFKYPHTPSLQLARMLRRDHPALYGSVETARQVVRYYRGSKGGRDKASVQRAGHYVNRIGLPAPEPPSYGILDLDKTYPDIRRWLLLFDLHVPFQDNRAVRTALDWASAKETRCDGVIYGGDLGDCYSLSPWVRDPRRRRFPDEIAAVGQVLDYVEVRLHPKATVWKAGNHEYRLERYLMQRAAEVFGVEQFSFPSFLGLDKRKVRFVEAMWPLKYRALTILHGTEWKGGSYSPVNPARTAYLKMHDCTILGHYHRTSEHTEQSAGSGRTVTCWSVGCLCDLHPEYAPLNFWNQGFAALATGAHWRVENKRIVKGAVV